MNFNFSPGTDLHHAGVQGHRVQDVIILGAGPAGLSAAISAARAHHSPMG